MVDLEHFRAIFKPLPGNHYLEVSTTTDEITKLFSDMMQGVGGEFNLALYGKNKQNLHAINARVQYIDDFKAPFRALPRDHDAVLLKDIFHLHQNQEMMLKLSYLTLANTANIIIMEKKGILDIDKVVKQLEDFEFRAPNTIEAVERYDLLIAKKMHMWGNGL
ncbi:hypothetical protein Suden_1936 [Sulfurimonas denitrificans DSM 1251]|uniref:Uncharacterized protein n=1 Tax=Sulfurimonas denitrificans (strain ATCC 33889 / DSM 1251) TaxID=326298 RepID=Q30P71_SULDN|nr:hypothetical protein [Sulfurimonas denitrificans]ABB45210.1 hypothetical protein Suden_1936 [Sulfurimonas denitrificans DSM 1251]MDD3443556.1 hypothetical protein [Sulfurimonas denitrificans]